MRLFESEGFTRQSFDSVAFDGFAKMLFGYRKKHLDRHLRFIRQGQYFERITKKRGAFVEKLLRFFPAFESFSGRQRESWKGQCNKTVCAPNQQENNTRSSVWTAYFAPLRSSDTVSL